MPEKRYLVTPGPTPVPPEVLAATALPMIHHRSADFRETFTRVIDGLKSVFRTENDVLLFTAAGTAAMESAVANVCSPGRSRPLRLPRVLRRALGDHRPGLRPRRRPPALRVGRAAEPGRGRRAPGGDRRRQGRLPDALGHLDGRRRRRAGDGGADRRLRRADRGRRDLEPRGRAAGDGRLGPRHRADELPQGADVPCRARLRRGLAGRPRGGRDRGASALLHGLAAARSRRRRRARRPSRPRSRSCAASTSRWR